MLHPTIFNTSEICHFYGVRHAVCSPGSRNAPLIISFARNNKLKKWVIPDERSAGFIALGIAQKIKEPVVLCCTSGTALLNYGPAVAEAFYREIPLIILSADRPETLIDQRDGQTIRQFEVFSNHVKNSIQLPLIKNEHDSRSYQNKMEEALELASNLPAGPVHINVPFEEPFYPDKHQQLVFTYETGRNPRKNRKFADTKQIKTGTNKRVLILVGQHETDVELNEALGKVESVVPILKSPLNNLNVAGIEHVDLFLESQEELRPEILITTGLSVLSKRLKTFLRKYKPESHFHFDRAGTKADTYQTKPSIIKAHLSSFLQQVVCESPNQDYLEKWKDFANCTRKSIEYFMPSAEFSETTTFHKVLKSLPRDIDLHLANSMPVRFAEMYGIKAGIETWSNRGTSGIDGCTSTAMGTCLVSDRINVLLSGDLSFLYDRNAFFHNYKLNQLRVIVFNNYGGGIFRLIEGPSTLPELEEYFEVRHHRTAEYLCLENKIRYCKAENADELHSGLKDFFGESDQPVLLEIFTDPTKNKHVFKSLKQYIHEQINL